MKDMNFLIKKGVYCSWCAELMKKTLMQNFLIKDVKVDIPKEKVRVVVRGKIDPEKIVSFLRKRGYHLDIVR
ncbi:heavy-metal-associated domain-containing protein [Candidatus Pacearchaeota archaeon]|nr:heavy-metal-associated domain-containing protein [Candidatus Pacearchaeota archaeon]